MVTGAQTLGSSSDVPTQTYALPFGSPAVDAVRMVPVRHLTETSGASEDRRMTIMRAPRYATPARLNDDSLSAHREG
jgi:hypothetical protein